jgi:hypothetical protein
MFLQERNVKMEYIKTKALILAVVVGIIIFASMQYVNAETELQPLNQNVDLRFLCTLNGAIPSASTNYNITISYPNGTTYLNNVGTNALGNGAFNYTTNFSQIGLYKVQMFCYNGTYSFADEGYYEVTNTGSKLDTSKTIVIVMGLGIMLLIGILLFIFGIYAKGVIKVFVIALSILLMFFSVGFTINILNIGLGEYSNLTNTFSSFYVLLTVLLVCAGIGLILWLVYFSLKAFSKSRGFEDE